MCGIVGILDPLKKMPSGDLIRHIKNMTVKIAHRGPDADGYWLDSRGGIGLGHRRLAILDLSIEAAQPMHSADGRYVLVFNGEIYNFKTLGRELTSLGYKFRGHSDTEIMLAAFSSWGVQKAMGRFEGMFAFGLWDLEKTVLYLGRDRLGEKPLYYGWQKDVFLFGSELKAMQAFPDWNGEINRDALVPFLKFGYIPAPQSIFAGMWKLSPGHFLEIPFQTVPGSELRPVPYWSLRNVADWAKENPFRGSESEAEAKLEGMLKGIVSRQMVSDVPLGAFLSGGVDSSLIVALMQASSEKPVKSFTIGFNEKEYDEAHYARAVAKHLGTEHTELYLGPDKALEVIPHLPEIYDEPFADVSQIPTYLISWMTRQHVSVSLSGDGGDELLAGYHRYFLGRRFDSMSKWLPWGVRRFLAASIKSLVPGMPKWALAPASILIPPGLKSGLVGDKLLKLADVMSLETPEKMYLSAMSIWKDPFSMVIGASRLSDSVFGEGSKGIASFTEKMLYFDTSIYLPDDVMVKVDRASMSVGLEARAPFLNHELMEFSWTLPMSMKMRNGQGKVILKNILKKYVPQNLIDRPKMGFGVPIGSWLRGPLKDWAEDMLCEKRMKEEGYLNPKEIRHRWHEHQAGVRNWHFQLWNVLMFQAWLRNQHRN